MTILDIFHDAANELFSNVELPSDTCKAYRDGVETAKTVIILSICLVLVPIILGGLVLLGMLVTYFRYDGWSIHTGCVGHSVLNGTKCENANGSIAPRSECYWDGHGSHCGMMGAFTMGIILLIGVFIYALSVILKSLRDAANLSSRKGYIVIPEIIN